MSRVPRSNQRPLAVFAGALFFALVPIQALAQTDPVINEFVHNHTGSDNHEFVETFGDASTDYSAFAVLEIEGDSTGAGVIDGVFPMGTTDAGGFFFTGFLSNVIENGTVTLLLVENFSGGVGNDLDTDNDGSLDSSPWDRVVDEVAVTDGGSADRAYASVLLTGGFDGISFTPGGASRIPNGADTDTVADWVRNDFDGDGLPGFLGSPMTGEAVNTPNAVNQAAITAAADPVINEFVHNHTGSDNHEFVETFGDASTDYSAFTVLEIEGDSTGAGVIDGVFPMATTDAGGFFFTGFLSNVIENGTVTLLLVENFSGGVGDDLDTDNDGTLEAMPWDRVVDEVAVTDGGSSDRAYASVVLAGGFDGISFTPGGASRIPNGADTDAVADWVRNDFNGEGLPGFIGTPVAGEAFNTPEAVNQAVPTPADGWVINEIHADPASNLTGDANGDGTRSSSQDEFVEIINATGADQDISGWTVADGFSVRHTFPAGTVVPDGCGVLIFGGGSPFGNFGGMIRQTASANSLGLNNGGDSVTLADAVSAVQATASYGGEGGNNQSLTLDPDVDGAAFVLHTGATGSGGALFSPGTRIDGTVFAGCPSVPTAPVEIFEIQGAGLASPFTGFLVTTEDNVVTAVAPNGFFIQTPAARTDGDPETSDGVFVFTSSAPSVAVGDQVDVTGQVQEFFNLTEISFPVVSDSSSGNPLPAVVVFDATTPSPNRPQPANELERFEGMLVSFNGLATGPTDRFGDTAVVATTVRSFREPGIEFMGLAGLPEWDGNPEIFEIDADGLGLPDERIFAGQAVSASGPLTFSFGDYQVLPSTLTLGPEPALPRAVRAAVAGELTIASQNVLRLFDDADDPGINEPVPTTAEFEASLAKFSLHIRENLGAPDIIAFQEVENLNTLDQLAARMAADDAALDYSAHLIEGNDIGGIDVGYLTRDDTVTVSSVSQFGATLLLTFDGSLLHDRPPLVLEATYTGGGDSFPITVINVHQRSLSGIEGSQATRVKTKRLEQAETLAVFIQDLQVADPDVSLVVTGDFNAFQFTDGFVDVLGVLTGNLDPLGAEFPGSDLIDPDLANEILGLPAGEQYSFVFGGSAQVLDHALTSADLGPQVTGVEYARGNADAPDGLMDDPSTSLRASDHDGLVLFILADTDGDGVADVDDACVGTAIPEGVPTSSLGVNRWALVDGDGIFDTTPPPGGGMGPGLSFTIEDTAGCSCEQIIDALGLGGGHTKFGCSSEAIQDWVALQ